MDFDLSDEHRLLQSSIRSFVTKEVAPRAHDIDETGEYPWASLKGLAKLGYLGLNIPEEYGGAGADHLSAAILLEELGRACGSTALIVAAHLGLACGPLNAFGNDAQKQQWLAPLAQGEMIDASRFGTAAGHAPPAALERLLRGSPGAAPGQWRGADPLLPNKTVLLLDGRLLVDFSEPDMQGVESVEIRGDSIDGPVLAVAARTSGPTPIDAGTLSVGRHYWAVLVPSSRPTQTPKRFTIAAPQEQQAVRERLRAFERQNAGPLATAMMRAAWLAQQDYDYDALVTMKSVGMRAR